jgi:hypothetical protein
MDATIILHQDGSWRIMNNDFVPHTHCFNHLYSCDIYKVLVVYVIVIMSLHMTIRCFSSICFNEIKDSKAQMMLRYLANHSI